MTDPITPPPELIAEWWDNTHGAFYEFEAITIQAARWGADQELEACVNWVYEYCPYFGEYPLPEDKLRAARRPKPPSDKELALEALERISPAAAVVLDAYNSAFDRPVAVHHKPRIAAALRAAADQVEQKLRGFSREACQEIRTIAAELIPRFGADPHTAAQAVMDAYINAPCGKPRSAWVAAALRAAADLVVPEQECQIYGLTQRENERQQVREEILAIAAELEGQ